MVHSDGGMTGDVSQRLGRFNMRLLVIAVSSVAASALVILALSFAYRDDGRIIRGIGFSPLCDFTGCDLSGMTPERARRKLHQSFARRIGQSRVRIAVRMTEGNHCQASWEYEARSVGIRFDVDWVVKTAYEYGRRGGFTCRLRERLRARVHGFEVPPKYVLDGDIAMRLIRRLGQMMERPPKDAKVMLIGERPKIIGSSYGVRFGEGEEEMTLRLWRWLVETGAFIERELPIFVTPVPPRVSTEDVAHIDAIIGKCTTYYSTRKATRSHNIRLAASAIDGKLIRQGEVFSFNEAVGPRCFDRGYKVAPVLVKGRFEHDIGGGVCQVSGTLFNAALRAGLEIVERHHHSRPIGYLPAGMDATVDYGRLDLKLRNPYPYPVCIKASAIGGKLTVLILGKRIGVRHEVRSELMRVIPPPTVSKADPSLPAGERRVEQFGRCGYVTATWRLTYLDGKLVRKELVHEDTYPPQPTIIKVGAMNLRSEPSMRGESMPRGSKTNSKAPSKSHVGRQPEQPPQPSSGQLIDVRKLIFNGEDEQ